ncbi:phosphopantetheine-binding protein [Algisphaera agarilytica]|uniref:Acyl carrier protein n=1 Tax=Algisphaera agarilytica TaxID=1385975 RepID=A0A7X0H4Q0_9BACT|nr:phosphopantetheine-binding protein [Algisphaera agarilytica]MBB6429206.1 acyl carrier protein [Algisphaera agarilytica]
MNPSPIQPPELSRDHVALAAVSAIVEVTSLVVADGADAEAMRLAQDLGMDSAQRIEVALEVEDDLDVALDDLRVGEIRTLGELIDHVCAAVLNPVANAA